ncbi:extracellular solute-binding protein [Polymorphospora rubra]|nr:extracellular solute-binding protein [Polymorphospora rubra]
MESGYRRRLVLGLAAALAAGGLTACGGDDADGGSDGKTKISVMGLPPTTQAANRAAFEERVREFEAANPDIDVEPVEYKWETTTFQAKLAGGTAETVFLVPFTEPGSLIERRQVADLSAEVGELPVVQKINPKILDFVRVDGKTYGIPIKSYTLGLIINRDAFVKAGLDPDRPPTTWDEVRTTAQRLKGHVDVPYAQLTTKNGGGWHLTAMTYSLGGTMQQEKDGKWVAAFNAAPATAALDLLKTMRWQDRTMGDKPLLSSEDATRDFAAGKIGMMINGSEVFNQYLTVYKADPSTFGIGALPQGGGNQTLMGGTVAMMNPKATAAQRRAGLKWIDFYYLRVLHDPAAAGTDAAGRKADNLPVGTPLVPMFDAATTAAVDAEVAKHANFPLAHAGPYIAGNGTLGFQVEPPVAAQEVYAALDPVVQAVLSRDDADIPDLLGKAEKTVAAALARAQ